MKPACPIPLSDLDDWVFDTATGREDLPIYRLASPRDLFASDVPTIASLRDVGLVAARRAESGTIEGRMASVDLPPNVRSNFLGAVLEASSREDQRQYVSEFGDAIFEEIGAAKQFVSYGSRIDSDVSVIGPGGRISIFRTATSIWVDITVRKRLKKLPSRWRAYRKIFEPYRQEFAPWKKQIEVEPMLGYFELSKYEAQLFLRPAFVFIFSMPGDGDSVSWQTVRVEPATSSKEISLRAGLGQWVSSGGTQ